MKKTGTKIANYTTEVPIFRTTGEIQKILVHHGASGIAFQYSENGLLNGIVFKVQGPEGPVAFQLPARWERVQAALKAQGVPPRFRTPEHAQRVTWRLLRDWLRAQVGEEIQFSRREDDAALLESPRDGQNVVSVRHH